MSPYVKLVLFMSHCETARTQRFGQLSIFSWITVALAEKLCSEDVACILESCVNMSVPSVSSSLGCHTVFALSVSPTDMVLCVQRQVIESSASVLFIRRRGNQRQIVAAE